jgi:glycosyltransferase involved in cell wall biosynthesis
LGEDFEGAARFEGTTIRGRGKSPSQWFRIRRWLTRFAPDVFYWNDPHAMTSIGVAASGMRGARLIARRTSYRLKSALPYRLLADRVICVSQAVQKQCIADGIPGDMARVVYDGVPTLKQLEPESARLQLALEPDDLVVTCAAALSSEKNQRTLIEAWRSVPHLVNGRRTVLLLAGEGPCRAELEQLIDELSLRDRVTLMGYREDMDRVLSASELFVMPSIREGLCSAAIQAMNSGCRILVAATGGLPELVGELPQHQGRVVPEPLASETWSQDLHEMMQHVTTPDDRTSLTARGGFFSVERMVRETITVMEEAIGRGRRSAA